MNRVPPLGLDRVAMGEKITQSFLRQNIWRSVLCATDQEIHEGLSFYPGAHGLCRFFALVFHTTVRQVAGIYAALSPMNGWDTNVSNIVSILREGELAKVNTSHINRLKAIRITNGEEPLEVLGGHKVRSFYQAIADPLNLEPIPVDRHLICLALGKKITSNLALRSLAGNRDLLSQIHSAYSYLGQRESIGNRLASIAWFVQRRIESGQLPILQPSRIVCCSAPMNSHGMKRFICGVCKRTISRRNLSLAIPDGSKSIPVAFEDGFPVTLLKDRKIITLGKSHQWANSAGWQYLSRYRVMRELGRKLDKSEHVHHKNLDKSSDNDVSNYRVLLAETHGKLHTYLAEIAGGRGPDGKFREYNQPIDLVLEVPF